MSTATLTPPSNLADLMKGANAAPKAKKSATPEIDLPEIKAITAAYPGLCAALKDAEARKDAAQAAIMGAALPHLCAVSRVACAPASSIRVNGLLMVRSASRTDLRDTTEAPNAVATAMNAFKDDFFTYFTPVVRTQMTPDQIIAINKYLDSVNAPCARVEYSLDWRPTPALHADRTIKPDVEALCARAIPQINPVQYVRA